MQFWTAAIVYVLAAVTAVWSLREGGHKVRMSFLILLGGGFALQTLSLYMRGTTLQRFPLTNPFEVLQGVAWCAVGLNLLVRQLFQLRLLNVFSSGLAALLSLLSLSIPGMDYLSGDGEGSGSPWVMFHAFLAVYSYAMFAVLALTSLMYLLQHRSLKTHRSGGLFRLLPSIRQLEGFNQKLLICAVSVLTLAVVIGFLNWMLQPTEVGAAKLVVTLLILGAYHGVMLLRRARKLIAERFAYTCCGMFVFVLASLWQVTPHPSETPTDPEATLKP